MLNFYPITEKSGRNPWIEYSQQINVVFCFTCRHFPSQGFDIEPAFISIGFRNWKKAQYSDARFTKYAKCEFHNTAMVMLQEY